MDNDVPRALYVQLTPLGGTISYRNDPRLVHDNGKPVYHYHLTQPSPCYSLDNLPELAAQYADTHEGAGRLSVQVMSMKFIEFIEQREKETR